MQVFSIFYHIAIAPHTLSRRWQIQTSIFLKKSVRSSLNSQNKQHDESQSAFDFQEPGSFFSGEIKRFYQNCKYQCQNLEGWLTLCFINKQKNRDRYMMTQQFYSNLSKKLKKKLKWLGEEFQTAGKPSKKNLVFLPI